MSLLFSPLKLRELEFKNRVFVSPMCQYSSQDGMPTDWHLVHLGSRAVGGAALVIQEATAVSPEGRISPQDAGIWSDAHAKAYSRITRFIRDQGSVAGIQLAHAGRKASTPPPWMAGNAVAPDHGGWQPIAPSPIPFDQGDLIPTEMTVAQIDRAVEQFKIAALRSLDAGFQVIEIHMAHGYLIHEFLSPLSNQRGPEDEYGGSLPHRMQFALRVAQVVREAWPKELPVFARVSATDWADGGWDLEQTLMLCSELKQIGVDLIDCSTGGTVPHAKIPVGPGYQVAFSHEIRKTTGIATAAVGLITEPQQAESIVADGKADAVCLARELLRNPYWPLRAAQVLGDELPWPKQYERAKFKRRK